MRTRTKITSREIFDQTKPNFFPATHTKGAGTGFHQKGKKAGRMSNKAQEREVKNGNYD